MEDGRCFFCSAADGQLCDQCTAVYSCTVHRSLHRQNNLCFPWRVGSLDGVGRVLIATRDIQPKEVVLYDAPVGLGPVQGSPPVCLQCFRLLAAETGVVCTCGFPMCSLECCKGPRHQAECRLYTASGVKMQDYEEYQRIMPIRMMAELEEDSSLMERFNMLMDHKEERMEEKENWNIINEHVVRPIREDLCKADWSVDRIQRCVGVTRTNGSSCTVIGLKEGERYLEDWQVGKVRVLYPSMSPMSHSCIPNCSTSQNPDFSLTVRTMRRVERGEELTISYTRLFTGRLQRQRDFMQNWFFQCSCPRCVDVTDLGTNFDTIVCRQCGSSLLPNQTNREAVWQCIQCGDRLDPDQVVQLEQILERELEEAPTDSSEERIQFYERFIQNNQKLVHPGHSILMKAKCKLLMAYENPRSRKLMDRKCELCRDLLNLLDRILPGQTEVRGRILYEASAPTFLLLQLDLEEGKIDTDTFVKQLKGLEQRMEECVMCLKGEKEGTYAFYLEEKANKVLKNIKEMIMFSDFLQ